MSLDIQWLTIAVMLGAGAGMGVLFDSYRVVSDYFKFPRWSLSIMDMLYWIISAIIVFRLLYASNFGEVRGYVFIGLVCGVILYASLMSSLYSKLVLIILAALQRVVQMMMRTFDYIIIKPFIYLYKFVIFFIKIGIKFTIRTIQIVLQLLLTIIKVILWPVKPLYKPVITFVTNQGEKWLLPLLTKWTSLKKAKSTVQKVFNLVKKWIYS